MAAVARGGRAGADQEYGGQRTDAGGEADQPEGANKDRAAPVADLAPGLGLSMVRPSCPGGAVAARRAKPAGVAVPRRLR
jgi:hypothetical protein